LWFIHSSQRSEGRSVQGIARGPECSARGKLPCTRMRTRTGAPAQPSGRAPALDRPFRTALSHIHACLHSHTSGCRARPHPRHLPAHPPAHGRRGRSRPHGCPHSQRSACTAACPPRGRRLLAARSPRARPLNASLRSASAGLARAGACLSECAAPLRRPRVPPSPRAPVPSSVALHFLCE